MTVYVIVVTYQPGDWLSPCFSSLLNSNYPLEIIAIDNGSQDNTIEKIRIEFPGIDLIENKKNIGFAKANNIGIKKAINSGADYVFLLNQDAWIEEDTIDLLLKTFNDTKGYGIISPIHLNGNGSLLDWGFCNYVSNAQDQGRKLYSDLLCKRPLDVVYQVEFVNAAAWLISKECIKKVGFFDDEIFIHYGEDENYIQRAHYHNIKIGICPNSFIYHDRENRRGKHTTSIFTSEKNGIIRSFCLIGANPNNKERGLYMRKEIRRSFFYILMNLFLFNFNRFKMYKSIFKQQKILYELLLNRHYIV